MNKIYCFNNGGSARFLSTIAMAEDGNCLAQHCCSDEYYMAHDLGITSDWEHENYNAHYGEGNWELEWVDQPDKHEGLKKAFELNKQLTFVDSNNLEKTQNET